MNAPIADRAGIDALLAEVVAELGAVGLGATALRLEACADDRARGDALLDIATTIKCVDRRIHLRSSCAFAGRAYESLADGQHAEAGRWRERAELDLERYRLEPDGTPS